MYKYIFFCLFFLSNYLLISQNNCYSDVIPCNFPCSEYVIDDNGCPICECSDGWTPIGQDGCYASNGVSYNPGESFFITECDYVVCLEVEDGWGGFLENGIWSEMFSDESCDENLNNTCTESISVSSNNSEDFTIFDNQLILVPIYTTGDISVSSFQFNMMFNHEFVTYESSEIGQVNNTTFLNNYNIPLVLSNTLNGGFFSSNVIQIDENYSMITIAYATSQIETTGEILLYIPFLKNSEEGCFDLSFSDGFFENEYVFPNQTNEFLINNQDLSECVFDGTICFDQGLIGCTDESSFNYNPNATEDDGSCIPIIEGCTENTACNYNSEANTNDESCLFEGDSCYIVLNEDCCCCGICDCVCDQDISYPLACESQITGVYDAPWNIIAQGQIENCDCVTDEVIGCTDPLACNYNPYANQDDGSCFIASDCGDCESIGVSQSIELNSGWSLFSTYICPFDSSFESIMESLTIDNNLVILKDGEGLVYWPEFGINNIGNLENGMGYLIKTQNETTLNIYGTELNYNYPINIGNGWSYLGYLNQECYSAVEMMNPIIDDFIILKNSDGLVYWPMFEINAIGNMCPGEGYQINVENPVTFSYLEGTEGTRYGDIYVEKPVHFEEPANTGNNMIIGLPLTSWQSTPSDGDEIAAYGEDGKLIGSTTFQGDHIALTVWGDDLTTDKKDGLNEGESISFKLWNFQTGVEQTLEVRWPQGVGFYTTDGISIAGQIILGSELATDKKLVRITDMLGRDVNGDEKDVMLLYIYDDGSIERVYIKE